MCAIVDTNVAHEVFGLSPQPTGEKFFEWINKGSERLVVGGKLLDELEESSKSFTEWAGVAVSAGKMRIVDESKVNARAQKLEADGTCASDDPHILALAQVSGARLLYSNDRDLQKDFKTKGLIDGPRGKVYSTLKNKNFAASHKRLLGTKGLCNIGRRQSP